MATITTSSSSSTANAAIANIKAVTVDYKEQAGGLKEYNSQLEEAGEGKAHVHDAMLNQLNVHSPIHSIRTIFRHGIQKKNTPPWSLSRTLSMVLKQI